VALKKTYTDLELVNGCIANNRICQERLYRKYFPAMMSMCMRYTKDRDISMEIINNGMMRVFKKLDTFSFKGSLEGWIRKLVYHSLSDYYKKNSKYLHFLVFEERDQIVEKQPLHNLYFDDLISLVKTLPDNTRKVFEMYAIEGFTHKEISNQLELSEGTSKWHLSSARKKLQEMLTQQNLIQNYAG